MALRIRAWPFGLVSALLVAEFWVHLAVSALWRPIDYPWWPYSVIIEMLLSIFAAIIACIRGSRWWVVPMALATLTLLFIFAVGGV
jgi:hypothetical protein